MRGATHGLELSEDFLAHAEFLKIGAERVDDVVNDSPVYMGLSFVHRISDFVGQPPGSVPTSVRNPRESPKAAAQSHMEHMQHQRTSYIDVAAGEDILSKTD